ncbi:MAG: PTS transporter subunit IIC [Fusobacteriaceae bacterium]
MRDFFKKKDIEFTVKRYLVDTLSFMALGLFSSLLIGTILKTIGEKFDIKFLVEVIWPLTRDFSGATIGVAVAYGLKAPPLVLFSSVLTGAAGNAVGGPAGALISTIFGVEFGKLISKETKLDIVLTPAVTIITGVFIGGIVGPIIGSLMTKLGEVIIFFTELHPFYMGIFVSVTMGMILTLPLSSAAISLMLGLNGLAAGAATVGCCSQMIGFATMSYKENKFGGFLAQGLGTSMLQMPNIIKNYKIWIPPIMTSAILGPISTTVFKLKNIPIAAGMGTSGLVGQIGTINAMENAINNKKLYLIIILLHFILPAIITFFIGKIFRKFGIIKENDLKIKF